MLGRLEIIRRKGMPTPKGIFYIWTRTRSTRMSQILFDLKYAMTSQITIPTMPRIIPTISPISNIKWYFGIAMRVIVVLTPMATLQVLSRASSLPADIIIMFRAEEVVLAR